MGGTYPTEEQLKLLLELEKDKAEPGNDEHPEVKEEKIFHITCRVGTVEQFAKEVFGVTLKKKEDDSYPVMPGGLSLGVQKFKYYGEKLYRLMWFGMGQAWLAAENTNNHRRFREALEAGHEVANQTGAYFSKWSR
jgi:hypothetical protein